MIMNKEKQTPEEKEQVQPTAQDNTDTTEPSTAEKEAPAVDEQAESQEEDDAGAEKEKKSKGFFKSSKAKYKEQIEELEGEVAELKDKNLRLYAEFENLRRRTAKEKLELMATASKGLMEALLPVVDDIDRAEDAFAKTKDLEAYQQGFELIVQKFRKVLEQQGLQAMDSKEKDFDPEWHEAIAEIQAPSEELKGKVLDVTEKGYLLNDKIIRYAKVVVGK